MSVNWLKSWGADAMDLSGHFLVVSNRKKGEILGNLRPNAGKGWQYGKSAVIFGILRASDG